VKAQREKAEKLMKCGEEGELLVIFKKNSMD
jgi:hypothetical protein